MAQHNELGIKGEIAAIEYLKQRGYDILDINWRFEQAEIDLVIRDGSTIVFVEVKTRTTPHFGLPEQAVDARKQQLMALAAEEYLEQRGMETDVRFDVVAVTITREGIQIDHVKDAFFPMQD